MREHDSFLFWSINLLIMVAILCAVVLNPLHKKNIEKLKETKPLAQHHILKHLDPVWFYKPDEMGWTKGEVIYVWGYHPIIYVKSLNKSFKFHEVEWTIGYE